MQIPAKFILLLWLAVLGPLFLVAQSKPPFKEFNPVFEAFQIPLDNRVQCIVQDSIGFLWFGTTKGLVRYDGRSFTTYRFSPLNKNSMASSYVESIFIDSKGLFWISHYNLTGEKGGLTVFNPVTEQFTRYYHDPNDPNSLIDNRLSMVTEDRQGYIWIGTMGGLDRFDRKTGTFKHFLSSPGNPRSLSYNLVRALYVDKAGTLWVGCGFPWDEDDHENKLGGLNRYDPQTESFTRFLHDPDDPNSLADNRVRALFEDSKGNFWVGTMGDGLHLMDRAKGTFTRLHYDPQHPERLSRPYLAHVPIHEQSLSQVTFVREDQNGRIWIGAINGGINVYDPQTSRLQHFENAPRPGSLLTNFVWDWCQARDGTQWIACGVTGSTVMRVKSDATAFPFIDNRALQSDPIYYQSVVADNSGNVWLGANGSDKPLTHYNRNTGKVKFIRYDTRPGGFSSQIVNSLIIDREGFIWAGTSDGLFKIHPNNTIAAIYKYNPNDPRSLSCSYVEKLLQDRNGSIWIATMGGGLNRYDPATNSFTHFVHDNADPGSIGGNFVVGLLEDRDGNLWMGGGDDPGPARQPVFFIDRIAIANADAGSFQHYHPPGMFSSISFQMAESGDDIWYTATPNGLQKLNKTTGSITEFTTAKGNSPSDYFIALAADKNGDLWMTTDAEILRMDPRQETFFTYSQEHGIRIVNFGLGAYFISPWGEHFVSGDPGFHAFYPEKLAHPRNGTSPKIAITSFFLDNKEVFPGSNSLLQKPIWETQKISLASTQNNFAFNIACFDFDNAKGNQLEFQLEPYDPTWRSDAHEGQIAYYNVPPGEYTFRVRGANSKGVWSQDMVNLHLVVRPPWQSTWWAYLLYFLAALGAIFGIYRFLLHRRMVAAEANRLKELDAVKSKLYTNITHEFRTPLTIISGMADQIKEDPATWLDEGLTMIKRNSNRLLQLVNQMLDLAKLESGKMRLHLQQGDVINYLKYLVESFHSYAQGKNIQIHFLSDLDAFAMDYDPEKLQQIMTNLLSNAVKFTPQGGHVYVDLRLQGDDAPSRKTEAKRQVEQSPGNTGQHIIIRVRDTGIGIPEEQIANVFDRFYQVDDTPTRQSEGTGIGLALTRELVKLMDGTIGVKSKTGKGAEFSVTLPVRRETDWSPSDYKAPEKAEEDIRISRPAPGIAKPAAIEHRKAEPASPLILLAEDNPDVVAYLASCLNGRYRLAVAKDGREAIEIATDTVPDLVISDVMMPHKDGFEVCRALRGDERTSHIPIVMLTAKADLDSKLEGLEHGADAYLAKPFHKEELLLRIRKLLELRQQLRQHYLAVAGLAPGFMAGKPLPAMANTEDRFVQKVRDVVEAHLDDNAFDVEQLCREIAMSHSQLHRKLSALTGFAATKFIRLIRLNKAQELLQNPALSITAIAFDTGFNDPSYFGRVFRQEFGVSPQEWRDRLN